jgi:cytochrome P450
MVVPAAIQLNPNIYEDPLTFNPWRWQVGRFFFPGWKKKKALAYLSVTMITQI